MRHEGRRGTTGVKLAQITKEILQEFFSSIGFLGGILTGILSKIFLDKLAEPNLEMAQTVSEPLLMRATIDPRSINRQDQDQLIAADILAYRVKITNRQKRWLNTAAKNCVAWLDIEDASETYQICWVGSKESVTINVGDCREVDVCAVVRGPGVIVAPVESGYGFPRPRTIGSSLVTLEGQLRVTCENGKKTQRRIRISTKENRSELSVSIE